MAESGVTPVASKPNPIVAFVTGLWNKLEAVDAQINSIINKITNQSPIVVVVIGFLLVHFLTPVLSLVTDIPATISGLILSGLAVAIPFICHAVPFIFEAAVGLILLVEAKNYIVGLIKK